MQLFPHRGARALAASALLVTAAAACSGGGGGQAPAAAAGDNLKITIVSAPLADPFFGAMKTGAEDAGKTLGVTVDWTSPKDLSNPGPDLARVGDAAAQAHPNGVVMSYFVPDAQKESLQKITGAGIPVVFMNAGFDYQALGGLNFVGEDPTVVGTLAGQRFIDQGKKDVICFDHAPGVQAVQQRCDALKKVFDAKGLKFTQVNVPLTDSTNPTVLGTSLAGALRADPSVDAVFTLSSTAAEAAAGTIQKAGSSATLGTTDLSTNVLNLIQDGKIAFASDQQPYLTGYESVQILVQYLRYGVHPIGAVQTAPNWVTKDNVADVIKINKDNRGIRGAA